MATRRVNSNQSAAVFRAVSHLNKNKFNYSQNIANYSFNLQDNSIIFASFDPADISILKNVKKLYVYKNWFKKKGIIDISEEAVRLKYITHTNEDSFI